MREETGAVERCVQHVSVGLAEGGNATSDFVGDSGIDVCM